MNLATRDAYMAEVAGPAVEFSRGQTIMEGGSRCDFCYRIDPDKD